MHLQIHGYSRLIHAWWISSCLQFKDFSPNTIIWFNLLNYLHLVRRIASWMYTLMPRWSLKCTGWSMGSQGQICDQSCKFVTKYSVFLIHLFINWSQIWLRNYIYNNLPISFIHSQTKVNKSYSFLKLCF